MWSWCTRVWLALVLILSTTTAGAEPPEGEDLRQKARAEAALGIEAFNSGDYHKAIEHIRNADSFYHYPTHAVYIARSYRELGETVEAYNVYGDVLAEEAPYEADEAWLKALGVAKDEAAALEPQVARLHISLKGSLEGVVVTINGDPVDVERLALPVAVLPGAHLVRAKAPGAAAVEKQGRPARGDIVKLDFELVPMAAVPTLPVAPPAPPPPPPSPAGPDGLLIGGVVALSVGVAAVVVASVTGAISLSKVSDLEEQCVGLDCEPGLQDVADEATTLGHTSTAMFVIGGAALAAGVVLLLLSGDEPGDQVVLGPGYVGLNMRF